MHRLDVYDILKLLGKYRQYVILASQLPARRAEGIGDRREVSEGDRSEAKPKGDGPKASPQKKKK